MSTTSSHQRSSFPVVSSVRFVPEGRVRRLIAFRPMRTVHNVIYQLTTTRAVLVTFGVLCGGLAFSTFHTYSVAELPQRNLLVMILLVICLVGIGSAVIAPNPVTRSAVGGMVLLHSLLRAYAFGLKEGRDSVGISDFLAHSSPMLVHLLLAYTGLLVWGRARHEAVR